METEPNPYSIKRTSSFFGSDAGSVQIAGVTLVGLAIYFGWTTLALRADYLIGLAGLIALAATLRASSAASLGATSRGILAAALVGAAWNAVRPSMPLTLGLVLIGAVGIVHVALHDRDARTLDSDGEIRWVWQAGALSLLGATWAAYYQFVALGVAADLSVRRVFLTVAWLIAGLFTMSRGAGRGDRAVRDAGAIFVAVAVGKALFYDTTHLDGLLRAVACAVAGLILLVSARLLRPAVRS